MTAGSAALVTITGFLESAATRFNAMYIRTEYFVSIQKSVVLPEEYNVTVKNEELLPQNI